MTKHSNTNNNTATTQAERIARLFNDDGMCWSHPTHGDLVAILDLHCVSTHKTAVTTRTGDEWYAHTWTFVDGSEIAEVMVGTWDVLDRFARVGDSDVVNLDAPLYV